MELVDKTKCTIEINERNNYDKIRNVFWNTIKNVSMTLYNKSTEESIDEHQNSIRTPSKNYLSYVVDNILSEQPLVNHGDKGTLVCTAGGEQCK